MDSVALSNIMGLSVIISAERPPEYVLADLGASEETLVIITALDEEGTDWPMAITTLADLSELTSQATPLKELAAHLPPLISLDIEGDSLDAGVLLATADTLSRLLTVPGVLIERDSQMIGAIARSDVAAALPLYMLGEDELRLKSTRFVSAERYICRKCVPPCYRLLQRTSQPRPTCHRVWFHGPMEPDANDA